MKFKLFTIQLLGLISTSLLVKGDENNEGETNNEEYCCVIL